MNDLVNKLKTFDYKTFALKHGEKIGLSVVIVFTLMALYKTSWGSFEKSPEELLSQAQKAMTSLTTLPFPAEKKQEFAVVDLQERKEKQEREMVADKYKFSRTFTPPIYPRMQPAERPKILPVEIAIVSRGDFPAPMRATAATVPVANDKSTPNSVSAPEAEEFDPELSGPPKPAVSAPAAGNPNAAVPSALATEDDQQLLRERMKRRMQSEGEMEDRPAARRKAAQGGAIAKPVAGPEKPPAVVKPGRGLRYVAFRAVFPFERQAQLVREALHHSGIRRAAADVEFYDFEIQRQRLVSRNPDAWGSWETLDYETALGILEEVANYAPDIVRTEVTNPVITMALPERLRGSWHWTTVGHPTLQEYLLKTDQEIEKELKINQEVLKAASEMKINEPRKRRRPGSGAIKGMSGAVRDMMTLRRNVDAVMMNDANSDYAPPMMTRRRMGMGTGIVPSDGQILNPNTNMNPQFGTRPNQGVFAITGSDPFSIPKWMLFRYLDFTVEPGECYRYRVRLEFLNPNYQKPLAKVVSADVREGETLKSDWCEPSAPIYVEPDVDVFLVHVPRHQKAIGEGAQLNVVEWDPRFGTNVTAVLKHSFGQIVGGLTKTKVLDPFSQSLAERALAIRTKDVFLDSKTIPPMVLAENTDLGLNNKQWERLELEGFFDQAVTVNTSADLLMHLPAAEKAREQKAMRDTAKERKDFAAWEARTQESDPKSSGGDALSRDIAAGKKKNVGDKGTGKNSATKSNPLNPLKPQGGGGRRQGGGGRAGGRQ